jgi:hypothetical protein
MGLKIVQRIEQHLWDGLPPVQLGPSVAIKAMKRFAL